MERKLGQATTFQAGDGGIAVISPQYGPKWAEIVEKDGMLVIQVLSNAWPARMRLAASIVVYAANAR